MLLDWYSGTPPYTVTPLDGIKAKLGSGVTVNYAANNDNDAAAKAARESDVARGIRGKPYHLRRRLGEVPDTQRR